MAVIARLMLVASAVAASCSASRCMMDTLGLVRAMLLRAQAMLLPGARLVPEMNRLTAAHNLLGRFRTIGPR
jgi:hypothetical protein